LQLFWLDLEEGKIKLDENAEDIHSNIEKTFNGKVGEAGKKLHTGRSRNDQVALDLRMYLKEEIKEILAKLDGVFGDYY